MKEVPYIICGDCDSKTDTDEKGRVVKHFLIKTRRSCNGSGDYFYRLPPEVDIGRGMEVCP